MEKSRINLGTKLKKPVRDMVGGLIFKMLSIALSFISVPIILNYAHYSDYGIYLALTSSFALINILDVGLGDGLRNKFSESKTQSEDVLARTYVSTTYFVNLVIALSIILIYFLFEDKINWIQILNVEKSKAIELKNATRFLITATAAQFLFQALLNMLKGDQKYITYSIINFGLSLSSIITIFLFVFMKIEGSIVNLVVAFFIVPNIILVMVNVIYFLFSYRKYSPSYKFIKKESLKELTFLSIKFFIINIMGVVALQSINIIVIRNFQSTAVVNFNLLFRYYFLLISIGLILFNPIWSTFNAAFVKKEVETINGLLNRSVKIALLIGCTIPIFIIISDTFISFWTHSNFTSSFFLNLLFGFWVFLMIVAEPYKMLIKGSGKLTVYLLFSIFFTIAQIVSSLVLIRQYNWNIEGILIGCILSQACYLIFFYLKSKRIIKLLTDEVKTNYH